MLFISPVSSAGVQNNEEKEEKESDRPDSYVEQTCSFDDFYSLYPVIKNCTLLT